MIFCISLSLLIYELEFFNESDRLPYVLIVLSGFVVSECLFLLFLAMVILYDMQGTKAIDIVTKMQGTKTVIIVQYV